MLVRPKLDPEQRWFREARFGMFVHFGIYALLGRGEWVMYHENIPREEYEKLARRFNPRRFDADQWVDTARQAGARYITVTAKHHDGFCLFDSALTDYKITNTPFRRDLIGELIRACHRKGMRIILYYSQPDWHHPNFVHRKGAFKDLQYERPGDSPDWPAYLRYMEGQVEELCTKYGRIDGIWFDGVQRSEKAWRGRRLYRMIRKHQPGAVVNDRAGFGDLFTPERTVSAAAAAAGYMVESCQSVAQDAWGYQRAPTLFSSGSLLRSLIFMAAAGGNYLLNVGPKPDGSLPADWVQRLKDTGDWLGTYGRAIYGAEGCPQNNESDDMPYTRRGQRLYLHLLRWPETDTVVLRMLQRAPVRAKLVGERRGLRVESLPQGIALRGLPSMPPDPLANVIEMEFADTRMLKPLPAPPSPPVERLDQGAAVSLKPERARLSGFGPKGFRLTVGTSRPAEIAATKDAETYLAFGWASEQTATWTLDVPRSMEVAISVEVACPPEHAGGTFHVRVAGQTLRGTAPPSEGANDYQPVALGTARLPAGATRLTLAPDDVDYILGRVRRVVLAPMG